MAMHQPGARVIHREGDGEPAASGQDGGVAAGGILEGEAAGAGGFVEYARAAAEDVEVVTVEMDGVRNRDPSVQRLLNDPIAPLRVVLVISWMVRLRITTYRVLDGELN